MTTTNWKAKNRGNLSVLIEKLHWSWAKNYELEKTTAQ